MSNTRPIPRTERPGFLRHAASDDASEDTRKSHQGDKPDGPPKDFAEDIAKGTPVHVAAFRRFATHCGTCGVIFLISLAWMLGFVPRFDSPFARASELQKVKSEWQKTKDLVGEIYVSQISADIRAYQDDLCRVRSPFLEDQLEKAQAKYESQTGRRYPTLPCPKQQ